MLHAHRRVVDHPVALHRNAELRQTVAIGVIRDVVIPLLEGSHPALTQLFADRRQKSL